MRIGEDEKDWSKDLMVGLGVSDGREGRRK